MRKILIAISAFGLAGCSFTVTSAVNGQFTDGAESFVGSATGSSDGSGTITITSSKGLSCKGNFVYITMRNGSGTVECANGQSGAFTFVSNGAHGTGTGSIGGKPFTFIFG